MRMPPLAEEKRGPPVPPPHTSWLAHRRAAVHQQHIGVTPVPHQCGCASLLPRGRSSALSPLEEKHQVPPSLPRALPSRSRPAAAPSVLIRADLTHRCGLGEPRGLASRAQPVQTYPNKDMQYM